MNLRVPMMRHWAALLLSAGVIAPAWADDSASISASTGLGNAGGGEIYTHICQGCHMPNGEGAMGAGHYPKLAGDNALGSWEYAALMVLNGRGAMPAFGLKAKGLGANPATPFYVPHLSDNQIAEVVNYLRSHFGNHYKAQVTGAQVAKLPHPRG